MIKVLLANGKGAIVREMQIRHYDDHDMSPGNIVNQHLPGLILRSKISGEMDLEGARFSRAYQ